MGFGVIKVAVFEVSQIIVIFLQIGERYHFTIFQVEREGCGSEMHIDATNFDFILSALEEPPRDYIVYIDEDFYVDGIIETIFLADTFSAGPPFDVNILSGKPKSNTVGYLSLK